MEKAILLAAGRGERMRAYSDYLPKAMLPAGAEPLIVNQLHKMENHGFKEVIIVVEPLRGPIIKHAITTGYRGKLQIRYVFQEKPLGVGHALLLCREEVDNDPFLYCLADEYQQSDTIFCVAKKHQWHNFDAFLNVKKFDDAIGSTGNLVVIDEKHRLVRQFVVRESRRVESGDFVAIGARLIVSVSWFFEILQNIWRRARGTYLPAGLAIQEMIERNGKVGFNLDTGFCINVDTFDDFWKLTSWIIHNLQELKRERKC